METSDELAILGVFGNSPVVHLSLLTEPPQAALGLECKHAEDVCLVEGILVWYIILPHDTQN